MLFRERLRWSLEYACVRLLALFLLPLPWAARRWVGRMVGRTAFHIDRKHRGVAAQNLKAAFPDDDEVSLLQVNRGAFEHLGRLLVEILFQRPNVRRLIPTLKIEGWACLQQAAAGDTGYFLASGHFGNWELVAHLQAALGYPLLMVTRPLDNPFLEKYFAGMRENTGNVVVHKRNAVRVMQRGLRAGKGIAFLIDQNFGEKSRIFVPFFGRASATTPVLGRLAVDLDAPVLPVFSYPLDGGGYRIVYGPLVEAPSTGDKKADAAELTACLTARLEEAVRKQKSAWFWMHKRWRTRPDGEES